MLDCMVGHSENVKNVFSYMSSSPRPQTVASGASPSLRTDIDRDGLLSKLLYLLMPISNSLKNSFRTTIILIQVKDIKI